jgi:restriction system protein
MDSLIRIRAPFPCKTSAGGFMAPSRGSRGGDIARWQQQQLREQQRAQRAVEAAAKAAQRDEQAQIVEAGKREAEERTAALQQWTQQLEQLLIAGLARSAAIDLNRMSRRPREMQFDPGELGHGAPEPHWEDFEPPPPGLIAGAFGGKARHESKISDARQRFEQAHTRWSAAEQARTAALASAHQEHNKRVAEDQQACERHNRRLREEMDRLEARQQKAVEQYLREVLKRLPFPDIFPRRADVAFNPEREQIVVQLQLPGTDVIPTAKAVRFVQGRRTSEDVARPKREIDALYRDVIAQVALLAVRDLFDADAAVRDVAFNGHVDTINRATGQR